MSLIRHVEREALETHPGVIRRAIVGRDTGAKKLATFYATFAPGASNRLHSHDVEEAMTIIAGAGLAILGGEQLPIAADETLLAPAGVMHAFVNTGPGPMIVLSSFPAVDFSVHFDDETGC